MSEIFGNASVVIALMALTVYFTWLRPAMSRRAALGALDAVRFQAEIDGDRRSAELARLAKLAIEERTLTVGLFISVSLASKQWPADSARGSGDKREESINRILAAYLVCGSLPAKLIFPLLGAWFWISRNSTEERPAHTWKTLDLRGAVAGGLLATSPVQVLRHSATALAAVTAATRL